MAGRVASERVLAGTDKRGQAFEIRTCGPDSAERALLEAMYGDFEPKECSQSLPPRASARRQQWVEALLADRLNLVALAGGRVVGHAALLEIVPQKQCEYLVFVHQCFQDRGIGTALTEAMRELARRLGYCRVWLTVEAINPRAIHVYEKAGFSMTGPPEVEREMELKLGTGAALPGAA